MRQKNFVLPIQCKMCSAVFDLWYDLNSENAEELNEQIELRGFRENLCWKCRQTLMEKLRKEAPQHETSEENEFLLSFEED